MLGRGAGSVREAEERKSEGIDSWMALSAKHQAFVEEYLQCWSAAEAYRRVYTSVKNNTAWTNGSLLLRKTEVREQIERRLKSKRMSADEVLGRLSDQAKASLEPFLHIDQDGFASFDFSSVQARMNLSVVKKLRTKRSRRVVGKGDDAMEWEDESVEVEVVDSQSALEKLGKHHKLFNDRMELVHTLDVEGYERMMDKVYGQRDDTSG